ncbi:hypothetical protein ACFOST_19730 [Cytobacillus kochii]|uniref:hypothetical protein n=1 Tax=Cytobacillus TaxID=2675230 RepID=UPI002785E275|nr:MULTISPECIES: hypothetical protein [Cytobacillus]MDQ0185316.1 hypothetical protein [Cytobacillus kochii]MEA1854654.1 hypothetical protein [Cytobacillus sp. OWB-43]
MGVEDKREHLKEEPFSFQIMKNQSVVISYNHKVIKTINGKEAAKFINKMENEEGNIQLLLAKLTGNFKRGNERLSKEHPKQQ